MFYLNYLYQTLKIEFNIKILKKINPLSKMSCTSCHVDLNIKETRDTVSHKLSKTRISHGFCIVIILPSKNKRVYMIGIFPTILR